MAEHVLPLSERERLLENEYRIWPQLAAQWLAAGYDSPLLREFALLSPGEGIALADLMSDVLASLGVPVEAGLPVTSQLQHITHIEDRCRTCLTVIAADVGRTWGELDLSLFIDIDVYAPSITIRVAVSDRCLLYPDTYLKPTMTDGELLIAAAEGLRNTLLEHFGARRPSCAEHGAWLQPLKSPDGDTDPPPPVWSCPNQPRHHVAAIGSLPAHAVHPPARTAENLAPPEWWYARTPRDHAVD